MENSICRHSTGYPFLLGASIKGFFGAILNVLRGCGNLFFNVERKLNGRGYYGLRSLQKELPRREAEIEVLEVMCRCFDVSETGA